MPPHHRLPFVCLTVLAASCATPLAGEPWQVTKRGSYGRIDRLGIYEDYEVDTRLRFDTSVGPVDDSFKTELIGRFGAATGLEYYVADDLALIGVVEYREFEAEDSPGILIDEVSTLGGSLALRWILPYSMGARLRPYLEGVLGYVPATRFDFEFDLDVPGTPNPVLEFRGDDYLFLGAAAGLVYQVGPNLVAHLGAVYEWPLTPTRDKEVDLDLNVPTVPVIPVDTAIDPEGWIAFFGFTYYF